MDVQKILAILDKNINQEQLAKDMAVELVIPLVDKLVADSANKLDDAAWGLIKSKLLGV